MLITVIVPIYNMEAYLCTSLDRLLQQSFQDYEILLIDDGSKDSSGEICDRYAREHSRISHSPLLCRARRTRRAALLALLLRY